MVFLGIIEGTMATKAKKFLSISHQVIQMKKKNQKQIELALMHAVRTGNEK